MNDRFLKDQRQEPPASFARSLRAGLRGLEDAPEPREFRLHPALAGAMSVAALAVAFTIPAVRVAAQNALDLFRVRKFAAVEISEERIAQLKKLNDGGDAENMLFEKQEVLVDPGPPQDFPSADLAGSAAGLPGLHHVRGTPPEGLAFEKAVWSKAGAARLTVRTEPLRQVLEALGINDIRVPSEFDGQSITVNMPGSVTQVYKSGDKFRMTVMEAMTPEVALPPGADLQKLGEVGLRVLGLDAGEARRVAASIDWKNTMLVPVPTSAGSFRQVDVNGHRGLLIRTDPGEDSYKKRTAMVMWTEGERVHAVQGNLTPEDILTVAQSLR